MHNVARLTTRVGLIAVLLSPISNIAYASSYVASAQAFSFVDATGGTILAGLTNQDDTAVSVPLPFTFRFFDTDYTSLFVSSNGLLTFGSANTAFTNADLTNTPNEAAIAAFWDD